MSTTGSSINKNNNNRIELSSKEIFSEQPMSILTSKGYTFVLLNGSTLDGGDALTRDNFNRFWTQSIYRVCVDGGANLLNDLEKGSPAHYIPHTIIGDMDSALGEVVEEYERCGVEVIRAKNQDSTDFSKALELILSRVDQGHLDDDKPIVVYGSAQCDRMDHQFALIQTLLKFNQKVPIYLVQDLSLTRVLDKGHHILDFSTGFEGKGGFGLFPVGQAANVITRGLKWDVDGVLEFGSFVSSSNEITSRKVEVTTSSPLVMTMQISRPPKECCGGGCS